MLMKHFQRKGIFTLLYFPSSEKDGICFAKEWNAKGIIIIGKFGIKEAFCKEFSGKIVVQMHLDNGIHFLL